MPAEYREAVEEGFTDAVVAGVEFCAMLAFRIMDGEYEAAAECLGAAGATMPPKFSAVIQVVDGEKKVRIVPTEGMKFLCGFSA